MLDINKAGELSQPLATFQTNITQLETNVRVANIRETKIRMGQTLERQTLEWGIKISNLFEIDLVYEKDFKLQSAYIESYDKTYMRFVTLTFISLKV